HGGYQQLVNVGVRRRYDDYELRQRSSSAGNSPARSRADLRNVSGSQPYLFVNESGAIASLQLAPPTGTWDGPDCNPCVSPFFFGLAFMCVGSPCFARYARLC